MVYLDNISLVNPLLHMKCVIVYSPNVSIFNPQSNRSRYHQDSKDISFTTHVCGKGLGPRHDSLL